MATNLELYPENYPGLESIEIESELDLLQKSLIQSSLKNVLAQRNLGQMSIRNQTRLIHSSIAKMTADFRGENISIIEENDNIALTVNPDAIPPGLKGRNGWFLGGDRRLVPLINNQTDRDTIERLQFIGELLEHADSKLSEGKQWSAVAGNNVNAFIFGAWNTDNTVISRLIDKLSYQDEEVLRLSQGLSEDKHSMGAVGTKAFAYLFGGGDATWDSNEADYPFKRTIERFAYLTQVAGVLAAELSEARSCTANIKGDKTAAWIFGGSGPNWEVVNTVEKFTFMDQTSVPEANLLNHNYSGHGNIGNENYIYLFGGKSNTGGRWQDGVKIINKFDMANIAMLPINIELDQARSAPLAINSNQFGYIAGGWGLGNNILPSQTMEKLYPLNESEAITAIGVRLTYPRAEGCGISTYGETFFGD